ncbi:MAG TPA: hypothetical protein VHM20_04100, partial [Gammaproteobacteria bacterium]|nr:hypothetical protein [Gammaproteobacteria bacterium]
FLKCPQEFSRFKPLLQQHREEFASLAEEKGSTKKIAGKMADIMQFAAVEKERDKVKEYNDYLKTKNFDLDCEVIGFSAIKKFAQYKKQADLAQEKLSNPESTLNKDIYDSARDYIRTKCSTKNEKLKADDKLTPIEGSEMHYLVSELQAIFPELNIDWVQVLIEGSALYLKEEFPVISMIQQSRDFIEYGSSIVLNMFKSAVDKDRYLQYKWELINKSIRGQSDPFSIQGDTVQEVELKKTKPPEPEPDIRPMQIIKGPDIKISNDFSPFIEVNSEGKKLKYSPHHLFKPAETQVDVSNPLQNTPALQF